MTDAPCRALSSSASATMIPGDLDRRLARAEHEGGRLVVLEGIYSMVGDRQPLAEFIDVKRRRGFQLLVDEAHSFGVLGRNGRGLAEEAGLEEECDFIVGTFSKSIGAIGGFGAGNHPMFELLRYAMRPYMFTASSSPASIATSLQALRVLKAKPELRERIAANSERLFNGFRALGLVTGAACRARSSPSAAPTRCPATPCGTSFSTMASMSTWRSPGTPGGLCLLRCSLSRRPHHRRHRRDHRAVRCGGVEGVAPGGQRLTWAVGNRQGMELRSRPTADCLLPRHLVGLVRSPATARSRRGRRWPRPPPNRRSTGSRRRSMV